MEIKARKLAGLEVCGWIIVLLWGLGTARELIVPVMIAALLAFMVGPLARKLTQWKLPQSLSVGIAGLVLLLPFIAAGFAMFTEGKQLIQDFPRISASATQAATRFMNGPLAGKLGIGGNLHSLFDRVSSGAAQGLALLVGGLSVVMNAGSTTALVLIFAILMVASRGHLRHSAESILATNESFHAAALLDEVTSLIQKFLFARMLIVLIIGAAAAISLRLFGVSYSVLLGGFMGVMTLVPAVGFIISLVPTLIVAFSSGLSLLGVVGLTAVLLILSFIEGNVLTPKMVGNRLNINALASFIGLLGGGLLWGVWGMFLIVPILGVIRIVFSAVPSLQPWGDLMAEREDRRLSLVLSRRLKKAA